MLKSLQLKNFRGFAEHRIDFTPESILIGQNNAGKTTTIEALRVLSVCQARLATASFIKCPEWLDQFCKGAGFRVSLETIDFDFANVQHAYDTAAPAIIKAKLKNNNEVHVYLGRDQSEVFCQVRKGPNTIIHSKSDLNLKNFGSIKVMPPVGSLLPREKQISKDRLNRYLDGYLAYRHFRNQMWEKPLQYRMFKSLMEETWHGLKIEHFDNDHGEGRNEYSLLVREGRFTSEISWHGHGLQAWMQTVWFLSRVSREATIVLDEPDVYLHADLQRKLIKVIEGLGFKQSIIATHSSEIIGDVPFQNVIVVQKREKVSKVAENANQIQECLSGMGSLHSIQLAKLAQSGLLLMVEGDDKPFLSDVAYKMGGGIFDKFSTLAIQEIKGSGNWKEALGAAKSLGHASGGAIQTALLIDRDYLIDDQEDDLYREAKSAGLILKIWNKKEIENYFLNTQAIARYISARSDINFSEIELKIALFVEEISEEVKLDLMGSFADVLQKRSTPKIEPKTAYKRSSDLIDKKILEGNSIQDIYGGKNFFSKLSKRCQDTYGISFSPLNICKEATAQEIDIEFRDFLAAICGNSIPPIDLFNLRPS